jgi:hypothetical protein
MEILWSAPAERSIDGALDLPLVRNIQSGVALRLPPRSKELPQSQEGRCTRARLSLELMP